MLQHKCFKRACRCREILILRIHQSPLASNGKALDIENDERFVPIRPHRLFPSLWEMEEKIIDFFGILTHNSHNAS
jgi:hypothetical protein